MTNKLLLIMIIPIFLYSWLMYLMFNNPDNNWWGTIFMSMPIGVMIVGLPLLILSLPVSDHYYGENKWYHVDILQDSFGIIFGVGFVLFLGGLVVSSMIIP